MGFQWRSVTWFALNELISSWNSFLGLTEASKYHIAVDIVAKDKYRYRYTYHRSCWTICANGRTRNTSSPLRISKRAVKSSFSRCVTQIWSLCPSRRSIHRKSIEPNSNFFWKNEIIKFIFWSKWKDFNVGFDVEVQTQNIFNSR